MKKWSRISNKILCRAAQTGVADMELRAEGQSFPRVTMELVAMELQCCVKENVGALLLIPSQPIQSGNNTFRAMEASIRKRRVHITLYLPPAEDYDDKGLISPLMEVPCALTILENWLLHHQAPDVTSWQTTDVYLSSEKSNPNVRRGQRLILTGNDAQSFYEFSKSDIQNAANQLRNGQLQSVDLTLMKNALWIRVKAPSSPGELCTVEASRPDVSDAFFSTQMPLQEACTWLVEYPYGNFLPDRNQWTKTPISKDNVE